MLKVFDENKHPFDNETGLVKCWSPLPWEHKDRFCDENSLEKPYFFVTCDNVRPLMYEDVTFHFQLLNSHANVMSDDYYVDIYKVHEITSWIDNDYNSFVKYKDKGNNLRKLHLYQGLPSNIEFANIQGEGDNMINTPTYKNGRVYINKTQYFDNVPLDIWEMQIGDDQPAKRWLKERKGLILTSDDILFYQKITYILYKTKEIMESID